MKLYEKYKRLNIDLSILGFQNGSAKSDYFCAPIGTKVLGWAGVDGIHYCTVKDFGDTIFAITPMSTHGNYIHPIAYDFKDLLSLLLTIKDMSVADQTYFMNKERFDNAISQIPFDEKREKALEMIKETFSLSPIDEPFEYIKKLQSSFDYRKIRFKRDYYEWAPTEPCLPTAPEWKVYFSGSFFGYQGRERAGEEIPINKEFLWGEERWFIPAAYSCASGIVIDLCANTTISEFNKTAVRDDKRERMSLEDRLNIAISSSVSLNGNVLKKSTSSHITWIPTEDYMQNALDSKWVLEHYDLDLNEGWSIYRLHYAWSTKRRPKIKSLNITLQRKPKAFFAGTFITPRVGECVFIIDPVTNKEYKLTVEEVEKRSIDRPVLNDNNTEFPACYTVMTYTLSPDMEDDTFIISDSKPSDPTRQKSENGRFRMPQAINSVAIAVIGGADGPAALVFGDRSGKNKLHIATSSLRFEHPNKIEWKAVFKKKMCKDISVDLI